MKKLGRVPRVLLAAATLLLGALFVTPLWTIRLVAPQYPEGLGMVIRLNTITGVKENDLRSINSLNHYIGMRAIEPDAIPELRFMPWIVAGLIVIGLVAIIVNRRRCLVGWASLLTVAGAAGLYDFWRWGYDYGHNLDASEAIIVVPGMTYQPPLVGSKQLLNFTATSWPALGGWLAALAFLCVAAALVLSFSPRLSSAGVFRAALATSAACSVSGAQIHFGSDACAECRMLITDQRFGALVITNTGRSIQFDSIDCMNKWLARTGAKAERTFVVDANHPGVMLEQTEAKLVTDGVLHPPMGAAYALAR
jgi:copper chaperone NosL